MHQIGPSAGSMQAGCHSPASTLDFGVRVALGQAATWSADLVASDEERQTMLTLRVQDRAC